MLDRQSHTVDSLRSHWMKFYEYNIQDDFTSVYRHAQLTNNRNAIACLINLMTFTVTSSEQALDVFEKLDGITTFQKWDGDEDAINACLLTGELDDQSVMGLTTSRFVLIMWLTQQYGLAEKYLDRLATEYVNNNDLKVHRTFDYFLHLAQAMESFRKKSVFEIPAPTKGYARDQKHFASLFVLMNALVKGEDIRASIDFVDGEFSASNKGKRSPKGFDLNDGEHRLKMPWNIHKYCILQFAKDHFGYESLSP